MEELAFVGIGTLTILLFSELITRGRIGFFTFLLFSYLSVYSRLPFFSSGYVNEMPVYQALFFISSGFCIGPLVLICALRAADSHRRKLRTPLHFIPAALVAVIEIAWFIFAYDDLATVFRRTFISHEFTILSAILIVMGAHILGYTFYHLGILVIELKNLRLEKSYLYMLLAVEVFLIFGIGFCLAGQQIPNMQLFNLGLIALTISGFFAVLGNFKHPEFFLRLAKSNVRYETISINKVDKDEVIQQLEKILVDNAEFKNSDLRISHLAQQLDLHRNQLSRIINEHYQCTFSQLVNRHRIEASKTLLATTRDKVLHIAYECGFNSVSSFNSIFKKETGLSPLEFRKKKQAS